MRKLGWALLALVLLSTPARAQSVGQWTSMPPLPFFPTAMHVLPTGMVMFYGGDPQGSPPGSPATSIMAWDPATGQTTALAPPGYDLFCAGHSYLADGKLLLTGGHVLNFVGLDNASLYDPFADRWTAMPRMNAGRWYPTNTTLANGDMLVISGQIDTSQGIDALPQVFGASTGTWRDLTSAQLALDLYPRMHLAPNGQVFNSGPSPTTRYLDTSATGSWTFVANRAAGNTDYGSAVMYDTGKILFVGGGDPPTNIAEVIDLTAASPAWRRVGAMAFPRRHLNATLLPDGKVLVTGGTSGSGFNDMSSPVYVSELWDPATERFTTLASQSVGRFYHSAALLLPDGRVMSSGGNGHPEVEVFSPPYLFAGARPTITSTPASVGYGQTFSVQTPDAASISKVTWIRLPSVTHAFDQNQRINRLAFTAASGALNVTAPTNANLAPPGHYMLFILNGQGIPSVAKIVQLGGGGAPPPSTPTLSSLSPSSAPAGSAGFTLTVTGTNFVSGSTVLWNGAARTTSFAGSTQLSAAIPASDVATAGSATVTVTNPGGATSNGLTFTIAGGGLQVWITQPTSGSTVSGTASWVTVWLDGTSGASNTVTATLSGRSAGSTTSSSPGPISFPFDTTVVADGTQTLVISARDAVGHTGSNSISVVTRNGISPPPPGASLSVSPTGITAGNSVSALWSGIASPTPNDWIGLYVPGTSDSAFLAWIYVSCSQSPGGARASGSCAFAIPGGVAPGTYELRLLSNNGYTRLATSNSFTVTGGGASSLSVTPSSVAAGGSVTATWSGIAAPSATDWIGLYAPGAADSAYLAWIYVSCSQSPAAARAAGSCAFAIPSGLAPGSYELRLLSNNGFTRLTSSNAFTVSSAPTLSESPGSVVAGSSVTATWNGIASPTSTDWVGLYAPGSANTAFLAWIYVSCSQSPGAARASGSCTFGTPAALAAGSYELRLLANNGYTSVATSNTFAVTR